MVRRILALLVVFGGVAAAAALLTQTSESGERSARAGGSEPGRWANWLRQQADRLSVPDVGGQ